MGNSHPDAEALALADFAGDLDLERAACTVASGSDRTRSTYVMKRGCSRRNTSITRDLLDFMSTYAKVKASSTSAGSEIVILCTGMVVLWYDLSTA